MTSSTRTTRPTHSPKAALPANSSNSADSANAVKSADHQPTASQPDLPERAGAVADLLKLLANPNRLLILCALMGGSLTVSSIAEQVPDISQSALSQNLSQLRTAGILQAEKSGQNVRYTLADQRIRQVLTVLEQNYCH